MSLKHERPDQGSRYGQVSITEQIAQLLGTGDVEKINGEKVGEEKIEMKWNSKDEAEGENE